jgi:hypothetical protein
LLELSRISTRSQWRPAGAASVAVTSALALWTGNAEVALDSSPSSNK